MVKTLAWIVLIVCGLTALASLGVLMYGLWAWTFTGANPYHADVLITHFFVMLPFGGIAFMAGLEIFYGE